MAFTKDDEEILRKGREALERIMEARTPEHKAASEKLSDARAKLGSALMGYYKCYIDNQFHMFVDGHPDNVPDALEWLQDRADASAIEEVLGPLSDQTFQAELPEPAWWVISEVVDILEFIERKDIIQFWRGERQ